MHYLLFYEAGGDYVARRAQFRDAHLQMAWKAIEGGELVLGGALANPVDGAVLLFEGDTPEVAEKFARADPYVTSGVVKRWYVREWTTVVGRNAAKPVGRNAVAAGMVSSESSSPIGDSPAYHGKSTIMRVWKGRAAEDGADNYVQHVTKRVFPALRAISGHRGAYLLRRVVDGAIEFVVVTLWESMDAVRRFAGALPDRAVVEPEARSILTTFDDLVKHYEIVHSPEET